MSVPNGCVNGPPSCGISVAPKNSLAGHCGSVLAPFAMRRRFGCIARSVPSTCSGALSRAYRYSRRSLLQLPGLNGVCQCQGNHRTPVACDSSVLVSSCARYPAVWPMVFFGIYDLAPTIGPVQPHAMLIGYILAFRWVLNDQRRRCPECLRRCGNPVHIGHPSSAACLVRDRVHLS